LIGVLEDFPQLPPPRLDDALAEQREQLGRGLLLGQDAPDRA
jgi:hypothetical protein